MQDRIIKNILRNLIVLIIACIISYFFARSETFWLPMAALFVMQVPLGSAVRHGLERFVLLLVVVFIFSYVVQSPYSLYARAADVTIGSLLGIAGNLLLFPVRVDAEFRREISLILQQYSNYLNSIANLLILKEVTPAEKQRKIVETSFRKHFPDWVYAMGFSITLRQGHRHFLVLVDKIAQLLFAMHYAARYPIENSMLIEPLKNVISPAQEMLDDIIQLIELKPLTEGVEDFEEEITILDNVFKNVTPQLDLIENSENYIYFAAFIYDLKDLRLTMLKLLEALSLN